LEYVTSPPESLTPTLKRPQLGGMGRPRLVHGKVVASLVSPNQGFTTYAARQWPATLVLSVVYLKEPLEAVVEGVPRPLEPRFHRSWSG